MRNRACFPRLMAALLLAVALTPLKGNRAVADDLDAIRQRGVLVVGVKADYPPFGFRAPLGGIVGIEPTLAADVARSLGVELALVPVSNRVQLLQEGKIDLIIATMNDTTERRHLLTVVKPYYYTAGYNILLPQSVAVTSWAALKVQTACGVTGAYYNDEAATNF